MLPSLINESALHEMVQVMQTTPLEGCIVEVGVYRGGSLEALLKGSQGRKVFGYDTFEGIPCREEGLDAHHIGDFAGTDYISVAMALPSVSLGVGIFPNCAMPMPPVSFAHLDVDQYRSYKHAIGYLLPKMISGGIMWFDDYGSLAGATKAVGEFGFSLTRANCGKAYVRL